MTTYLGKSCSFGLPRVPVINCHQFMYLVISLSVWFLGQDVGSDCTSSLSLLIFLLSVLFLDVAPQVLEPQSINGRMQP